MNKNNNAGRRQALKGVAAMGAAASLPAGVLSSAPAAAQSAPAGAPQVLTATEAATLDALCARLIPSDDGTPGAKEARAVDYIDRSLAGYFADSRKGAAFTALSPADQDAVLTAMQKNAVTGFMPNSALSARR